MSEPQPTSEPIVTTRGLSERSRQLLQSTQRSDPAAEAPRNARPHRVNRSLWWPLLYFVLVMSIADVAIVPLCWGAFSNWHTGPLLVICSGLVAGQVYVIALGLVFGRDSLSSRILLASGLLFLIFLYVAAGHFASIYSVSDAKVWQSLGGANWLAVAGLAWCAVIAVLIGLIAPLLMAHLGFGWRLTNADELRECLRTGSDPPPVHRYGLRDVLMLMVLVSLVLAVPRSTYDPRMRAYEHGDFWAALAIICCVACAVSSLQLFFLWLLLHGPDVLTPRWVWPLIVYTLWGLAIAAAVALIVGLDRWLGAALGMLVASVACFGGTLLGLLMIRAHGWRMESKNSPLVLK